MTIDTTIAGFRIFYADGSEVGSAGPSAEAWSRAPADGVIAVVVYYRETYRRWISDRWVTENYRKTLRGHDYYWRADAGALGSGDAPEVPPALSSGALKLGRLVDDGDWQSIIDRARSSRTAP